MLKLLALAAFLVGTPALANPALWVAHGPKATVYLFGSIHMLRPGTAWQSAAFRQAFDAAADCWFEVTQLNGDFDRMKALVGRIGFDPDQRLSNLLSPEMNDRLSSMLGQHAGATQRGLGRMRPWAAAYVIANTILSDAGYEANLGADYTLENQARVAGKVVEGLETIEMHFKTLADLPQDIAIRELDGILGNAAKAPEMLDNLVKHWQAGEADLVASAAADWIPDTSEAREIMLTKRDVNLANAVENFLKGSKVVLGLRKK